jgi:hypothetical protein
MWPFKHTCKEWSRRTILVPSLLTGVPVGGPTVIECRCGKELRREISAGSAYQQLGWGADYNKLLEGEAVPAEGKEEEINSMREQWYRDMGYTSVV